MRGALAVLMPLALALGALAPPASACPTAEQGFQRLVSPQAEIAYRWEPAELKVGQFFAAEIVACRTHKDAPAPEIRIDATMPAHGHGMNYRPSATSTAPGRYRFTGLMLHMPGTWQIAIDLLQDGKRTRLTREVNLAP